MCTSAQYAEKQGKFSSRASLCPLQPTRSSCSRIGCTRPIAVNSAGKAPIPFKNATDRSSVTTPAPPPRPSTERSKTATERGSSPAVRARRHPFRLVLPVQEVRVQGLALRDTVPAAMREHAQASPPCEPPMMATRSRRWSALSSRSGCCTAGADAAASRSENAGRSGGTRPSTSTIPDRATRPAASG